MFDIFFFFQAEDGIRDKLVTGVQTCALPISAFWTPVTPARDRPSATSGMEACRSSSSWRVGSATPVLCRTVVQKDTSFAKLVSLGCHDVRTPLATVHGFAKMLEWVVGLAPPADRYVEMIGKASAEMA